MARWPEASASVRSSDSNVFTPRSVSAALPNRWGSVNWMTLIALIHSDSTNKPERAGDARHDMIHGTVTG